MLAVHPDAELAPRDIVARAIHDEIAAGRRAFLDCRAAIGADFAGKFPTVFGYCRAAGIDPVTQPIPVAPAAHYHMGGVLVDANGRTSIDGLWACGETASTGAHGANRLASNSLLEAVVFAARIADDVRGRIVPAHAVAWPTAEELPYAGQPVDASAVARLRRTMTGKVGVVRDAAGLTSALEAIAAMEAAATAPRLVNMLTAATLVAAAALARTESRGGHFRSDHPRPEPAWRHRTFLKLSDAERISAAARQEQKELLSL
jgi:L-aspartate oxidase